MIFNTVSDGTKVYIDGSLNSTKKLSLYTTAPDWEYEGELYAEPSHPNGACVWNDAIVYCTVDEELYTYKNGVNTKLNVGSIITTTSNSVGLCADGDNLIIFTGTDIYKYDGNTCTQLSSGYTESDSRYPYVCIVNGTRYIISMVANSQTVYFNKFDENWTSKTNLFSGIRGLQVQDTFGVINDEIFIFDKNQIEKYNTTTGEYTNQVSSYGRNFFNGSAVATTPYGLNVTGGNFTNTNYDQNFCVWFDKNMRTLDSGPLSNGIKRKYCPSAWYHDHVYLLGNTSDNKVYKWRGFYKTLYYL